MINEDGEFHSVQHFKKKVGISELCDWTGRPSVRRSQICIRDKKKVQK